MNGQVFGKVSLKLVGKIDLRGGGHHGGMSRSSGGNNSKSGNHCVTRLPSNIPFQDWQLTKASLCERGQYLLESGLWSDCQFIVGLSPNIKVSLNDS